MIQVGIGSNVQLFEGDFIRSSIPPTVSGFEENILILGYIQVDVEVFDFVNSRWGTVIDNTHETSTS